MKKNVTNWLDEYRHPLEDVPFALPGAIHFLTKFRPDLADFESRTTHGRMMLYFWWNAHGKRDYPDFDWTLRERDLHYLRQFDAETLITEFPACVALWLRNPESDVLDRKALLAALGQCRRLSCTDLIGFPRFLDMLVVCRHDLRQAVDPATFEGQLAALHWWDLHGQHEYLRINWRGTEVWADLNEVGERTLIGGVQVPHFIPPLLTSREDLPASMKTGELGALLETAAWWDKFGSREYPNLHWNTDTVWSYLNEMHRALPTSLPAPRFVAVLHEHRADLKAAFRIDSLGGQLGFFEWWNNYGQAEWPRLTWTAKQDWEHILMPVPTGGPGCPTMPRFLVAIWSERPDLQAAFRFGTVDGALGLAQWWQDNGKEEYASLSGISVKRGADGLSFPSEISRPLGLLPYGVNVVGFPQGALGLGEDARMAARAFEELSVPVVLINAPMAGPAKRDHSADRLLSEHLRYGVSLFCLPPPEMVRLALEGGRCIIESNTYRIGAWPWELPHWPQAFGKVDRFVDEIWAQSRFVESVYSRLGRTPVHHMPMVVDIPKAVDPERKRFGLDQSKFLFYLMFDGNSWLSRKNPVAGVQAFQKAFGADSEPVGLVVKAMNVRDSDAAWQMVCKMASEDSRIQIISEHFSRQDSIDFMTACDAYISLHRSEGFGRVIAEAMSLGQPVVVTNFSGNVDFCTPATSYLVDGELVPLRSGEYLFHEGQYWCDPDVGIAAAQLRRLYENPGERARIAAGGRAKIAQEYSFSAVARAYERRLRAIFGPEAGA